MEKSANVCGFRTARFQVSSQLLLGSCNRTLMGLSFLICKMGAGGGDTTTYLTHGADVRKKHRPRSLARSRQAVISNHSPLPPSHGRQGEERGGGWERERRPGHPAGWHDGRRHLAENLLSSPTPYPQLCKSQPAQIKKRKQNKRKHNVAGRKEKQMQTHTFQVLATSGGSP